MVIPVKTLRCVRNQEHRSEILSQEIIKRFLLLFFKSFSYTTDRVTVRATVEVVRRIDVAIAVEGQVVRAVAAAARRRIPIVAVVTDTAQTPTEFAAKT